DVQLSVSSGERRYDRCETELLCGGRRDAWPQCDRVGVERHERSRQAGEVLRVRRQCDIEILGRSPASMRLWGDSADDQIVHTMLVEHSKELSEVQWTLGRITHERT